MAGGKQLIPRCAVELSWRLLPEDRQRQIQLIHLVAGNRTRNVWSESVANSFRRRPMSDESCAT
jgi:hypothetical protein